MVIADDSAGGNLATDVSLMLTDRGNILPKGTMLIYPVLDQKMITESMKLYTDTPIWDEKLTEMMWKAY